MPWSDVTFDLAFANGAVLLAGIVLYALLGGADFGGGIWDLLAHGPRADKQRQEIARAIGPIWEANHVWLIFVLVVLWTAFSGAFAAVVSTLYIPLTLAAFGMIARGAAFAFRKSITTLPMRRFLGALFALSSLVTPFFLGAVVGAVASGRVPAGIAAGDVVTVTVKFKGYDMDFPLVPFIDDGMVAQAADSRVENVPTQPEVCT